jgi:hypothetical protein
MGDPDRHVRKGAVVALSAVVHHKPALVTSNLPELLPLLFEQTVIREDMVCVWVWVRLWQGTTVVPARRRQHCSRSRRSWHIAACVAATTDPHRGPRPLQAQD